MTRHRTFHRSLWFGLSLAAILVVAAAVRVYGLSWDRGTHLHPDERFLTMVVSGVRFPSEVEAPDGGPLCEGVGDCLAIYWDTDVSPLNPANHEQFASYVYGTLPLFATRAVGQWLDNTWCAEPAPWAVTLHRALRGTLPSCARGTYTGYGGVHLVGRVLSTTADLAALLGLALLARHLYGRPTGLLAAALYAFAVLPIQHAHFFVVDSFATVFVVWTLYFAVLSLLRRRLWLILPAGLLTGLAVASKISVFPLAAIVALAGLVRPGPSERASSNPEGASTNLEGGARWKVRLSVRIVVSLVLAGALAALAFRTAQPYAFKGPGFFDVGVHPQWLATMREIRDLMTGARDVPFGHQWTARAPLVFPWRNMVIWGLGLVLGSAAWIGWGVMGWRIVSRGRYRHLVPWVWATGFFVYQATQWVKSMRYLLPVYPVFVIFAAWFALRAARWGRINIRLRGWLRRGIAALGIATPVMVLLGAGLWAWAFLAIYRQPVTRIEATRWMYEHVPTAVRLRTADGDEINVPFEPDAELSSGPEPATGVLGVTGDVTITEVVLPQAKGVGGGGNRQVQVAVKTPMSANSSAVGSETVYLDEVSKTRVTIPLEAPIVLGAGTRAQVTLSLVEGPPMKVEAAVIANEHWDDPLPLRIDGKDPFWNWYQGLSSSPTSQMNNYDNDTLEKRMLMMAWLDEADYIVLSSNRLYASIPRLPKRYPLTTEYYRLLLNGSLGFNLAASFVSYPALGPCQFPDQEVPFPLVAPRFTNARPCSIELPPAEEAFSVYDHPTVLIFEKTPAYSRTRAEVLLPTSLLDDVQWMTPREATRGTPREATRGTPRGIIPGGTRTEGDDEIGTLLMSPRYRMEQEAGGTWSRIFNRNALQNRYPRLGVFLWGAFLTCVGWIIYPILYALLPNLRYRGYGLARMSGLLIWSYIAWLLASLRLLPYTRAVLWLVLLGLLVISALVAYRRRRELGEFLRLSWRHLLAIDVIFMALFMVWVGVRWMNPDLWHPVTGGEKPMDLAYLNAVIKSTWFPPYDPWFAGGTMNYYYFGFVIIASVVKVLGIVPSMAYNLAIPSLYALIGVGAYMLASNLAGGSARRGHRAGIWGLLFVLVLGNLGEVQLIFNGLANLGDVEFESLIPGYPAVVSAVVGLWKVVVEGAMLPFRPEWWYWEARSLIPAPPGEVAPINEFPAFTLLYADLHAHVVALPITQLALGVALQWGLATAQAVSARRNGLGMRAQVWQKAWRWLRPVLPTPLATLLFAGVVIGALKATNTWDYPTYLALMSITFIAGLIVRETRRRDETMRAMISAHEAAATAVGDQQDLPARVAAVRGEVAGDDARRVALSEPAALNEPVEMPERVALIDAEELAERTAPEEDPAAPGDTRRLLLVWLTPWLLYALAELLFQPYVANYAAAYGSIQVWEGSRTPLGAFLFMHAHLLLPLTAAAFFGLIRLGRHWLQVQDLEGVLWFVVGVLSTVAMLALLVGFFEISIAWLVVPLGVAAAALLVAAGTPLRRRYLWLWLGTALAITLFVELFVLRGDISRMNTVFKFYFQAWLLLGLTGGVVTERMFHTSCGLATLLAPQTEVSIEVEADDDCPSSRSAWLLALNDILSVAAAVLLFGAALYPVFAIPGKIRDRWTQSLPHTLDGMAFMRYVTQIEQGVEIPLASDYRAIRWFQQHVEGSPTIMEMPPGGGLPNAQREYRWGNRISVYTGLPAVIGWRWHQVQQRMVMPAGTVEQRQEDVRLFYSTTVPERALDVLKTYDVAYIILGPYERAYMLPEGENKLRTMVERGWLEIAYQEEDTTIYRVVG